MSPRWVTAAVAAELSRRDFLRHATVLGVGALIAGALPVAERMLAAQPARAAVPLDGAMLQAFADTVLPGRRALRTDLGDEIHPQAIAGVDPEPGAVEADALRLFRSPLLGFPLLAPAFIADLTTRSLAAGGIFLALPYDEARRGGDGRPRLPEWRPDRLGGCRGDPVPGLLRGRDPAQRHQQDGVRLRRDGVSRRRAERLPLVQLSPPPRTRADAEGSLR